MTVNSQASKTTVACDGITTVFAFNFIGVAATYIDVVLTDAAGNETAIAQGTGSDQCQVAINAL